MSLTDREARGFALLMEWLSPEQSRCFDENGYFDVVGSDTLTRFRIHRGTQVNIEQLAQDGRAIRAWCVLPEGDLVVGDVMLAQKIALENNESAILSVAISYAHVRRHRTR
jgi:hypothetical protein